MTNSKIQPLYPRTLMRKTIAIWMPMSRLETVLKWYPIQLQLFRIRSELESFKSPPSAITAFGCIRMQSQARFPSLIKKKHSKWSLHFESRVNTSSENWKVISWRNVITLSHLSFSSAYPIRAFIADPPKHKTKCITSASIHSGGLKEQNKSTNIYL